MTAIILLFALIPSAICITTAGYLAVNGLDGWGWFLFVGMILGSISYNKGE